LNKLDMTMSKYRSPKRKPEPDLALIDKIYNSCSVEFWLIVANLVVVTNWLVRPESLGAISLLVFGLGLTIVGIISTDLRAQQLFRQFQRDHRSSGLLTLVLGLVVGITIFNFATDPSHALILTNSGEASLKKIFGGTGSIGGTVNAGIDAVITNLFLIFKALFFISFMWALYKSYEKYTDQSDLGDVIKTPLILLIVVGTVDTAAKLFLG
jgi:hypothetical protein